MNVNRYKLAQQWPELEARSLALGSQVIMIQEDSPGENEKAILDTLPAGIHFIGFEQFHVGYVLKDHGKLYVIHSNYMQPEKGVMIEQVRRSDVFPAYTYFYIAPLSTNEKLLRAWIEGKAIRIFTEE